MLLGDVSVVIGANFGDEGKGLVTDFLAASKVKPCLVVRFNGGAQAGHTVVTPRQQRHVFSHIGSGSFCEARTYLSRYFVTSPIHFVLERERLVDLGVQPQVFVDPASPVTTLYDIVANRMLEMQRCENRHGSCGVGFGETLERESRADFSLTVADLQNPSVLRQRLTAIRYEWLPKRLAELEITQLSSELADWVNSDDLFEQFLRDVDYFLQHVTLASSDIFCNYASLIFEGAQGLQLDQDRGDYPHVTRSNTGLQNVAALLKPHSKQSIQVTYVTRSYLTRHGAGRLSYELSHPPFERVIDETNITNPYQGALRFGWLNLDLLTAAIQHDLTEAAASSLLAEAQLAITCLDQVSSLLTYVDNNKLCQRSLANFFPYVAQRLGIYKHLYSYGSTREAIKGICWAKTLGY